MDEILVANFMVFHDLVSRGAFDLVVADEGWDLDYFLHENPELKRSPFAWLTDFVGWMPLADGGAGEAALTADYNAEMVEQIARYPRLRDRSVFVGNPADLVDRSRSGRGCPPSGVDERSTSRSPATSPGSTRRSGTARGCARSWATARTSGSASSQSGVPGSGRHLLQRVAAAFPAAQRQVAGAEDGRRGGSPHRPALRHVPGGVQVRGYVPDLYRELVACDIAVVQGGLTTTMELVAGRRPFLYFPLAHHFEQQVHVPHRLAQYGAGRRMDYATSTPETIADAIAAGLRRRVDYLPVETDGARRAARLIHTAL